jgi:uncharacterized protein (TIGR04222 family)
MNPFNLPGPDFLALYASLLVVACGAAALLRWLLRLPGDEPFGRDPALSPYEVAYLAGGTELAVNAAVARLVHQGGLAIDADSRKLSVRDALPAGASGLERAVYLAADCKGGEALAVVYSSAAAGLEPTRRRLQELGLLVPDDAARTARLLPLLLVLAVTLFGVIKIFVGLSRSRPVVFLIGLCVVSAVAAVAGFGRAVHRSRRGERMLVRIRRDNAALEYQAGRRVDELSGDDLVLGLGLFGLGILAAGPLADLRTAIRRHADSSSSAWGWWGGGCGGGSCGGGCGGGGCGGGCGGCGG